MISFIRKIVVVVLFLIMILSSYVFAENINISITYGVNNIAKSGTLVPITIKLENKDKQDFKGYFNVNIYESNESVFIYKNEVEILGQTVVYKNLNIPIANNINNVIIEVYNDKSELCANVRTNFDLSNYNDRLILGVITSDINSLLYIDDLSFYEDMLKIKVVEINEEMYDNNKYVFDIIDGLLISDIDLSKLSDGLNYAIQSFVENNKPVIVSLGGDNGIMSLPQFLYSCLAGPTYDKIMPFYIEEDESKDPFFMNMTCFRFIGGKKEISLIDEFNIELLEQNGKFVVGVPFSFNNIDGLKNSKEFFEYVLVSCLGEDRIERMISAVNELDVSDYYNINNLLNIVDKSKLPDIYMITMILIVYFLIITVLLYVCVSKKRHLYGIAAIVIAIFWTGFVVYKHKDIFAQNAILNYVSMVDLKDTSSKETVFLNFRTNVKSSYSFNTSANNKLYPMIKSNKNVVYSNDFLEDNKIRKTIISKEGNVINIDVNNANDFDSNIFIYENNNFLNDIYNINCDVKRYDREISGRITNNMDINLKDAGILLFGKVLKVGDVRANHSITLQRAYEYNVPMNNSNMIAEIMANNVNQNIIKYYLDENIYGYYDNAYLFGFIDDNGSINLNSSDVDVVNGRTLLVKKVDLTNDKGKRDICILKDDVVNIKGGYDINSNTIMGDEEVINEYNIDVDSNVVKIYIENISNYDSGKLDYNVPFYGNVYALNINTNNYDLIENGEIVNDDIAEYIGKQGELTIKFIPSSRDILYRSISCPYIRVVIDD